MFAFLNDLSVTPEGVVVADNWNIIKQLLRVSAELKSYGIILIRVPEDFVNKPVAGTLSLAEHVRNLKGDDKRLLLDFMGNRLENRPSEIENILRNEQQDKLEEIAIGKKNSQLLLEAYLTNSACLSLTTHTDFCVDFLKCEYVTLSIDWGLTSKTVSIENLYSDTSFTSHRSFLSEFKKQITFSKTKWKPKERPIWNSEARKILDKLRFPLSPLGFRDKREELMEIGTIVAELNGWRFNAIITKKNKNPGQLRQIFHSRNSGNIYYLSIDFENAYGRFELHDYKGNHLGEIAFVDGSSTGTRDTTGNHNIIVK